MAIGRQRKPFDSYWMPEPMTGCWLWIGGYDTHGYGKYHSQGAHRAGYERWIGPIPEGLELDHLCRTPACINPEHLEPVTSRENTLRGTGPAARNASKTHCFRGHAFTAENTRRDTGGYRQCRACDRLRRLPREART